MNPLDNHPHDLRQARPKEWIEEAARELEKRINKEIRERWPRHCRFTYERLVQQVVDKHLNGFWGYRTRESVGRPTEVMITEYNGKVEE